MNQRVRTPLAMVRVLRVLVVESLAEERRKLVAELAAEHGKTETEVAVRGIWMALAELEGIE